MKIAFHSSYFGYRGTEIALMDYARGNREILKQESLFLLPWAEGREQHPVADHLRRIAPLYFYRSAEERERVLRKERVDFLYCIKNGWNDGVLSREIPTGIHAIFRESEFHGDVYAYVSPWLSRVMSRGRSPWVPHMVRLAEEEGDLRREVGFPPEARVFGRHGGDDSFDIPWVRRTVAAAAAAHPSLGFLFLNTRAWRGVAGLPNVRFLPPTADPVRKRKFLNSCDAMLHGRARGETFGLSCLEFAMLGKPVLTFSGSPERAHLEILGDFALPYAHPEELWARLQAPDSLKRRPDSARFAAYQPQPVMKKFAEVFLRPSPPGAEGGRD